MAAPVLFLGLPQSAPLDLRIDLDAGAAELSTHGTGSERSDLDIGPLAWKDMRDGYDTPRGRRTVRPSGSRSRSASKSIEAPEEGRLVLYAGGWADLKYCTGSSRTTRSIVFAARTTVSMCQTSRRSSAIP